MENFLGERLLDQDVITAQQLEEALVRQKRQGGRIGHNLVALGYITDEELTSFFRGHPLPPRTVEDTGLELSFLGTPFYFDVEGNASSMFGRNGDWPGDFSRPKGVAADSYGHVYIVDALLHTVQIFDKGGRLLLTFGERGHGEGQFWLPNGIFITPDNMIFVADVYNKRVQVFRYVGGGV